MKKEEGSDAQSGAGLSISYAFIPHKLELLDAERRAKTNKRTLKCIQEYRCMKKKMMLMQVTRRKTLLVINKEDLVRRFHSFFLFREE